MRKLCSDFKKLKSEVEENTVKTEALMKIRGEMWKIKDEITESAKETVKEV